MAFLEITNLTIGDNKTTLVNLLKEYKKPISIDSSLALVGQSGSGKSLTLKTILGMLPKNLTSDFQYKSDFQLTKDNIGFIPQNPFTSLSPMTKINKQFFNKNNTYLQKKEIDQLLETVGLESKLQYKFPIELSGGQLQRIVIAITLSRKPTLLLLDEPTTALDEKSKETILDLILSLQQQLGFIFIFVSHDIESIKNVTDQIAVVKNGFISEYGETETIINNPTNQYTKNLIESNFENREFRV